MHLSGSTVLVTGASRGIGAAFVECALERGATRVYAGVRDLASVNDAGRRFGDRLAPLVLDMTVAEHAESAARSAPELDLLVCNAGMPLARGVLDPAVDEQDVRTLFETNVIGPMRLARALAPTLRRRRGAVVFVHSTAAVALSRSSPIYAASKAAALMVSLGLREELRADGVSVTNVFPGFVATAMAAGFDIPKVAPRQVAARSLDGAEARAASVFPDRFSERVADVLGTGMHQLLDEPKTVMNAVVSDFLADPLAGF